MSGFDLGEQYDDQLQAAMLDCQDAVQVCLAALGEPQTLESITCMAVSWAFGAVKSTEALMPGSKGQAEHLRRLVSIAAAKVVAHWAGEARDVRTLGKGGIA